jgi:Putative zinc-finger
MSNEAKSPSLAKVSACFDPELGGQVFDYVSRMLTGKEEAVFEEHLLRCDKCYQTTIALDWAKETLRARLGIVPLPESAPSLDTEAASENQTNSPLKNNPVMSSTTMYLVVGGLVVGGLGVLGLVALGVFGFARFSKLKRSLMERTETAPS